MLQDACNLQGHTINYRHSNLMIAQVVFFCRHVLNLVPSICISSVAGQSLRDISLTSRTGRRRRPQSCGSSIGYMDQWMCSWKSSKIRRVHRRHMNTLCPLCRNTWYWSSWLHYCQESMCITDTFPETSILNIDGWKTIGNSSPTMQMTCMVDIYWKAHNFHALFEESVE